MNKWIKQITLLFLILGTHSCVVSQKSDFFTVYLVRHSEKETNSNDPHLTKCGELRSESLSRFLSNVPLDRVYSTNYNRTQSTALPTALSKGLTINEYDPSKLSDFSRLLIESKKNALIVGHSNTTGVLAGLLTGKEIHEFDLDIYDRIYQVTFYQNKRRLHLFHSAFNCNDSIKK